jgi:hypothetical protein
MKTLLVCSTILVCLAAVDAAADQITPLWTERVVAADVPDEGERVTESVASTEPGVFAEGVGVTSVESFCAIRCMLVDHAASASQQSIVTLAPSGALEIRMTGAAQANSWSFSVPPGGPGPGRGLSRLTSMFTVESVQPFVLQASGERDYSIVLRNEQRVLVEHVSSGLERSGSLEPGSYTLIVETTSGYPPSKVEARFAAGGALALAPRCRVDMDLQYASRNDVTARSLVIENPGPSERAVEAKIWLRHPDGQEVPLRNDGVDGALLLPAGFRADYRFPWIMTIDEHTVRGIYELGCRLVDPVTGRQFHEDGELFVVP